MNRSEEARRMPCLYSGVIYSNALAGAVSSLSKTVTNGLKFVE